MAALMLILPICLNAQTKSDIKSVEELINPGQLKETFIYWGNDLLVIVPDSVDNRKIIRAFHTPLNPNPETHLNYDNDILDGNTLRPLEKHTSEGSVIYDYGKNGKVTLKFIGPKKNTVYKTIKTNKPTYIMAGPGTGVLTASLPLKIGFNTNFSEIRLSFPYRQTFEVTTVDYTLKVIGEETITLNNKTIDTYIVEIDSEQDNLGVYKKSWVTKDAPHYAVKFLYRRKEGNKDYKTGNLFTIGNIFVNR